MAACIAHNSVPVSDAEENSKGQIPATIVEESSGVYRGCVTRLGDLLRQVEIVDDEWGDVEFPTGGFLVADSDDEEGFDFDADSIITSVSEELADRRSLPVSHSHSPGLKKVLAFDPAHLRHEESIAAPIISTADRTSNDNDDGCLETGTCASNEGGIPSSILMSPASIDGSVRSQPETVSRQSPDWYEDAKSVDSAVKPQCLNFESSTAVRKRLAHDNEATPTKILLNACPKKGNLSDHDELETPMEEQFPSPASPPSVSNNKSQKVGSIAMRTTTSTSSTSRKSFQRVAWGGSTSELKHYASNIHSREESCSDVNVSTDSLSPTLSNFGDRNVESMDDDFDFDASEPVNHQLQLSSRFVNEKQPSPRLETESSLDDWSELPNSLNTNSSQENSSPSSSYTAQRSRRGSCASPTPGSSAVSVIMSDDDEHDSFDEIIIPEEMSTLNLAIRKCDDDPNASLASDTSVASEMDVTKENIGYSNASEKADSDDEDILSGLEVSEGSFSLAKNPHVVSRLPGIVSGPTHHLRRESISFSSVAAAAAFASPHTSPISHSSSRIPRLLSGALSPVKATLLSKSPDTYEMQTIIKSPRSPVHSGTTSPSKSSISHMRWGSISPSNPDNTPEASLLQKQPARAVSLPNSPCQGTPSINTNFKKNGYSPISPSTTSAVDNARHPSGANGNRTRTPANPPAFGSSSPARIPLGGRFTGRVSRGEHDYARIMRRPKTSEKYGDGSELDSIDDLPTGKNGETPGPLDATLTNNASARRTPVPHPTRNAGQALLKPSALKSFPSPSTKLAHSKKRSFSQSATSHPDSKTDNRPQSDNSRSTFSNKKTGSSGQSIRQRKPANKPTLIKNLNASTTAKVVGDMVYNPALQRWEGNEGALKAFEKRSRHKPQKSENMSGSGGVCSFNESRFNRLSPSLSSFSRSPSPVKFGNNRSSATASSPNIRTRTQTPRARPALITQMGGDGGSGIPQVIGTMVFDPKQMRWLSTEADEENVFAELEDTDTEPDVTTKVRNNADRKPSDLLTLSHQLSMWQESDDRIPREHHNIITGQDVCKNSETPTPDLALSSSTSNRGGNYNVGEEFVITPMLSKSLELAEKAHRSELGTFWPRGFGGLSLDNVGPKRILSSGNIWKAVGGPSRRRMSARDTIAAGRSHLYDIKMIAGGTTRR